MRKPFKWTDIQDKLDSPAIEEGLVDGEVAYKITPAGFFQVAQMLDNCGVLEMNSPDTEQAVKQITLGQAPSSAGLATGMKEFSSACTNWMKLQKEQLRKEKRGASDDELFLIIMVSLAKSQADLWAKQNTQ